MGTTLLLPQPSPAAFSSSDIGTAGAQFLKLGADARALSMGGAVAASIADASSLAWNPAGVANIRASALSATYASYLGEAQHSHTGFAHPLPRELGTAAVDLSYLSYGSIAQTDAADNDIGSFNPYDLALALGYGRSLGELSLGAALRVIQSRIVDSASTFAMDAGVQWRPEGPLRFGAALQHLGPGLKYESESAPLPTVLRGGAQYRASERWSVEADIALPRDNEPLLSLGAETLLVESAGARLFGRAGYTTLTRSVAGIAGPSFGFGVARGPFGFDYGLSMGGELGLTHRLSFRWDWGDPEAAPRPRRSFPRNRGGRPPPPPPPPHKK
ncbi:MAG: PorV/PorQ family protein, partial [Elusimicrobiota bacterium]